MSSNMLAGKGDSDHKEETWQNSIAASAVSKDGKRGREPVWDIKAVSLFCVPSLYLLVHMLSLFCLDSSDVFYRLCEEVYMSLNFSFSIKEVFDPNKCSGRDEMQVVKNIYVQR